MLNFYQKDIAQEVLEATESHDIHIFHRTIERIGENDLDYVSALDWCNVIVELIEFQCPFYWADVWKYIPQEALHDFDKKMCLPILEGAAELAIYDPSLFWMVKESFYPATLKEINAQEWKNILKKVVNNSSTQNLLMEADSEEKVDNSVAFFAHSPADLSRVSNISSNVSYRSASAP